jgi:hypothetical protein
MDFDIEGRRYAFFGWKIRQFIFAVRGKKAAPMTQQTRRVRAVGASPAGLAMARALAIEPFVRVARISRPNSSINSGSNPDLKPLV